MLSISTYKKLIHTYLLLCTVFAGLHTHAQQIPTIQQYVLRPELYNPAASGVDGTPTLHLMHRQYWNGFNDAPSSSLVAFQGMPFIKQPFSLGATIDHDRAFVLRRTSISIYPSLHLTSNTYHTFSLGINLGVINYNIDYSQIIDNLLSEFSRQDPLLNSGDSYSQYNLNAGVGIQYRYAKDQTMINIGVAAQQLAGSQPDNSSDPFFDAVPHILAGVNLQLPLSTVIFEPSLLYKAVLGESSTSLNDNTSLILGGGDLDVLAAFTFPNFAGLSLGGGTRWDITQEDNTPGSNFRAVNGMVGINLTPQTRLTFIGEIHQDLPLTFEAGITFQFGTTSTQTQATDCYPLWRNPECLQDNLRQVQGLSSGAEVTTLIGSRRVILTYAFEDNSNPYNTAQWSDAGALAAHIIQTVQQMLLNQEELLGIQSIDISVDLRDSPRILELASLVGYDGEFGNPTTIQYSIAQSFEEASIASGNINRKELALLKLLAIQQELNRSFNLSSTQYSYSLDAEQPLNSLRKFEIQVVFDRAQ